MHCWPWRYPAGRRHPSPRWAARWRWCCAAGGESKWGAGSIRVHWSSWCACWRGSEHVRLGRGNANLPGGWGDGHAQGLRGPVWYGAGTLVMRSTERACLPIRHRTTQSPEAAVLGWQRPVGVRQAPGEGTLPLAGDLRRGNEGRAQPRGTGAVAAGHRHGRHPAPAMVPARHDSSYKHTDIRISYLQVVSRRVILVIPTWRASYPIRYPKLSRSSSWRRNSSGLNCRYRYWNSNCDLI